MDATPAEQVRRTLQKTFLVALPVMICIGIIGFIMMRIDMHSIASLETACNWASYCIIRFREHHFLVYDYYSIPLSIGIIGGSISAVMLLVTLFIGRTKRTT